MNPISFEKNIEVIRNVMKDPPIAIAANIRNRPLIPMNSSGRCKPL